MVVPTTMILAHLDSFLFCQPRLVSNLPERKGKRLPFFDHATGNMPFAWNSDSASVKFCATYCGEGTTKAIFGEKLSCIRPLFVERGYIAGSMITLHMHHSPKILGRGKAGQHRRRYRQAISYPKGDREGLQDERIVRALAS